MTESVLYWNRRSEPVLTEQIDRCDLNCPGLAPDGIRVKMGLYRAQKRKLRRQVQTGECSMRFEPSREMKVNVLPEQEDQLCTKDAIREIFARDDKGECCAFDIFEGAAMVGFAMFCEYPAGTFFLWNYAIDAAWQNRGLGKKAILELMEYMIARYPVKEFTTTYVWGNEHARRLYESAGFVETDVVEEADYKEVNMIRRISEPMAEEASAPPLPGQI